MNSLRARVAVAAVLATTAAFVLSVVVVVGTFLLELRGQAWWDRDGRGADVQAQADERVPPFGPQEGEVGQGPPPFIRRLAGRLVLTNLLILVLVGAAGLALGGAALRPLALLRAAAERVASARDLDTRLPQGDGPEEVDALAGSLNAMLERLQRSTAQTEAALESSRRFAADAGHELRTPLTSMRANLDVLARSTRLSTDDQRIMADVSREQERLLALLDGLQRLARGDAAGAFPRERADLAEIVDAAVSNAANRHPRATITFSGPDQALLDGWPDGLRLLVDNLIDNAVRHSRPDVTVDVSLAVDDSGLCLTVDDDGPGIPPGDRARVFERFTRGGATSAPGSGLGLALVAQQAAVHDGGAAIETSPAGGTRVVVRLARPPGRS